MNKNHVCNSINNINNNNTINNINNINNTLNSTESDDDSIMDYINDNSTSILMEKTDDDLMREEDMNKPIVLGIDLGTTNSCISIWRNNTCEIIPDEYGNKTIPSYVSYTNISKYVGHEAKKQKDINVENVFYEVKRLIGRSYDEKAVQDCLKFLSYKVIENDRGCVSLQSTIQDNKIFTPEEISSQVLMKLKDMAQKYLKRDVKDVVITVPAHFNDSQRQATKDAASIAGLNCIRMFHEPTAAALAYGMLDRSINKAYNSHNKCDYDINNVCNSTITSKSNIDDKIDVDINVDVDVKDAIKEDDIKDNIKDDTITIVEMEMNNIINSNSNSDINEYEDSENDNSEDDISEDNSEDDNSGYDDQKGMLILVYDFGGGTLDVSLIEVYDGMFEVLCSSGISHLGGVDFDNRLMNYCIAAFIRQHYKGTDKQLEPDKISRLSMQRLRTQCESVKKVLSTNVTDRIAIENFHDDKDMFVKINRNDFENLCRDLFLLCLYPVDEILSECGKSETDIDDVILVGGMTRMPYIREMLNNKFRLPNGKTKVNCSINPDEAVSVGAAIQGYILANRDDPFSNSVTLTDITPLSLGVEVIGGVMDTIIKRNSMIPDEKTKFYTTDTDNIDSVLIKIFEGERTMTDQNYKIGEFELDKIPLQQRGMPEIEITFSIDINGIVKVSAIEREVNEVKSITVNTNKNGLKPHQLAALIEEAIEQETMDEIDRVKKFSYYEMDDLCANIINNINNKEFKLTQRDITTITDDIKQVKLWLKEKTYKERELEEFDDALQKMKQKYGVLILQGKLENDKVKAIADYMDATTLYGKNDDEEEEELRQAFEKVEKEELGIEGMSDSEIIEIKDLRDALMELCKNVCSIINSGRMNIDKIHKQEILNYIDDIMMWYYSHEKPTKIDYRDKIDYVNAICDEIVEKYESDGKDLFLKGELNKNTDTNSQRLEKLCLTLITMIENNQLCGSKASLVLLKNKIKHILKYVYTKGEISSNKSNVSNVSNNTININNININNTNNINNTDNINEDVNNPHDIEEEFQNKCDSYIKEVNDICDKIYNNLQGISLRSGPVVSLSTNHITNDTPKIVTDEFKINYHKNDILRDPEQKHGLTILELLRMKQNEEMVEAIDRQMNNTTDYV